MPRKAVSMGIGTIMRAKKIVLLVNGENKAEILERSGQPTGYTEGTWKYLTVPSTCSSSICDEEAAKYL